MSVVSPSPLRDYQTQGVAWLVARLQTHRAVLLCDDPGLGKTRQALAAAQTLNAERILVVCPAGARRVWQLEIARWIPVWSPHTVLVEPGVKVVPTRLPGPLVLVVGYDELSQSISQLVHDLTQVSWDLLIVDEAHYLKNFSNRTKSLYGLRGGDTGIQARATRVILLTGTPTPNHAGELWQHCRTFWPWSLAVATGPRKGQPMSQAAFEDAFTRYRDTVYGRQVIGSKNQAQLRERLAPVVLRRRKDAVLAELPPLQCQDIPLDLEPDWQTKISLPSRQIMAQLDSTFLRKTDNGFLAALRAPDMQLALLRRQLGELKVQPTIRWIQERMNSTSKMLVFAWHHSVIEHLRRGLEEFTPVVITGDTAPTGRANAVELFQTRSGVRLFIGQVLAAGTAITLTAASEVAIVEPSWVPGENVQAICRAHRLGQRDSVLASFLYLPGTLDERIMRTFRRKAVEISELQGDTTNADTGERDFRSGNPSRSRGVRRQAAADVRSA